ncbi:MAG: chtA [Planctomycetota bacterium]|nr:chtA [Planctomycetota bacterium]
MLLRRFLRLPPALALGLLLSGLPSFAAPDEPTKSAFRVVGYLPDYRMATTEVDAAKSLTDVVVFSVEPTANGGLKWDHLKPESLTRPKEMKRRHGVRLLLGVGGWDRSSGFAPMSASAEARKTFGANVVRACREHGLDGVDIDWEHPASKAEESQYATLLTELKAALSPHHLSLTLVMAGWQSLPPEAFRAVDRIHLMAYDAKGRHSTYDFAVADVARLTSRGVPPAKIVLGLPFYGRGVTDRSRTLTYAEIVRKDAPPPDRDEVDGVYFNGPATIERKVKFARDHHLAGVMIWEIGQDAPGDPSLLRAIHRASR